MAHRVRGRAGSARRRDRVNAGAIAGAIAFAGLGVLPLYLRYLTAVATVGFGRPAHNNGFAASLTGVFTHVVLVVAFLAAVIVAWRVTTAVARALPQREPVHGPITDAPRN